MRYPQPTFLTGREKKILNYVLVSQDCEYIMLFIIKIISIDGLCDPARIARKLKAFVKNFFLRSHLTLNQTLIIIYCWAEISEVLYIPLLTNLLDESKFFHRKYNRGRWKRGTWVFGGKCFLVEVDDRRAETLTNLIER
jgi:hypothetical protein